jgi:hypothetical protein
MNHATQVSLPPTLPPSHDASNPALFAGAWSDLVASVQHVRPTTDIVRPSVPRNAFVPELWCAVKPNKGRIVFGRSRAYRGLLRPLK